MKRFALVLSVLATAAAAVPAVASTNDPSSPFYLLPTQNRGTTLHTVQAADASTERK